MAMIRVRVHIYSADGTRILTTRVYAARAAAWRAIRRAQKRGLIARIAGRRSASDPPTCHH